MITYLQQMKQVQKRGSRMQNEDERKWFDFHGIQPELAELYRYFDRTVLCYRIIIAVLLGIIAILLLK